MGVDTEVDTDMEDEVSEVDSEVDSENKIPICFFALSKEHENESLKFGHQMIFNTKLCLTYYKIVSIYLVIY